MHREQELNKFDGRLKQVIPVNGLFDKSNSHIDDKIIQVIFKEHPEIEETVNENDPLYDIQIKSIKAEFETNAQIFREYFTINFSRSKMGDEENNIEEMVRKYERSLIMRQ